MQTRDAQSDETLHRKPSSQRVGQTRPQSTSVSLPLRTPSSHPGEVHTLFVQIPESQSFPRKHGPPSSQSESHAAPHAPSTAQGSSSPTSIVVDEVSASDEDEEDSPSPSALAMVPVDDTETPPSLSPEVSPACIELSVDPAADDAVDMVDVTEVEVSSAFDVASSSCPPPGLKHETAAPVHATSNEQARTTEAAFFTTP